MLATSTQLQPLAGTLLVEALRSGALVLDVRAPEQFVSFHIRRAIQIGLAGPFASWAAMLIPSAQKLVLVADDIVAVHEAHTRLTRVGLENVIGYSLADEEEWRNDGIDVASICVYRSPAVRLILLTDPAIQLVDVRSQAEWLRGHLPGAISLPLLDFDSRARRIDQSKPSLLYCHEGFRATTAASILLRESDDNVDILIDGVEGWLASGLPLVAPHTVI